MEMARITSTFVCLQIYLLSNIALAEEQLKRPPVSRSHQLPVPSKKSSITNDQHAIKAYEKFWSSFEKYQEQMIQQGQEKYERNWTSQRNSYYQKSSSLNQDIVNRLRSSAQAYKKQLQTYPNADNRPYVLFNLAQLLFILGENNHNRDAEAGEQPKLEAINVIGEIIDHHSHFPLFHDSLYLLGIIHQSMGHKEAAQKVWQRISKLPQASVYQVYANIALGDQYFWREQPVKAVRYYDKAIKTLNRTNVAYEEAHRIKAHYRLVWASYRSGQLNKTLKSSRFLLQITRTPHNSPEFKSMQTDAIKLMGDVLYEKTNLTEVFSYLGDRSIAQHAPNIGFLVQQRHNISTQHRKSIKVGDFIQKKFPLAKELPRVLSLLASSYKSQKLYNPYITSLEKLALLLPKNSLWRNHHQDHLSSILEMEKHAFKAAQLAATWLYKKGVQSNRPQYFLSAASYYSILLSENPDHQEAIKWRLNHANSLYFAGHLEQSIKEYEELIEEYQLDSSSLMIASYQLVLSKELVWRNSYTKLYEQGKNPSQDEEVQLHVNNLDRAVDQFVKNFPNQNKSVELLLISANANRDMNKLRQARVYWNKVLIAKSKRHQRKMALRGIVFSYLKGGSSKEVIEKVQKYLNLEDWSYLGASLKKEFLHVLSRAALDEAKQLNDQGKIGEGGQLLIDIATEFPRLPKRGKLFRDGSYMLAISAHWSQAQKAAQVYLASKMQKHRSDMIYLLARSFEFQLKFQKAATQYLKLGRSYPRHQRAKSSLMRATTLADAEHDYKVVAAANEILGNRIKRTAEKLNYLKKASEAYAKNKQFKKSLALARKMLLVSKTTNEKLHSRVTIARSYLNSGYLEKAEASLQYIISQSHRFKNKIGFESWSELIGESQYLMGSLPLEKLKKRSLWEKDQNLILAIKETMDFYQQFKNHFRKSIATKHPLWAPKSRYILGAQSEALADSLAQVTQKNPAINNQLKKSYFNTIERLRVYAKKQYSDNLISHTKDPGKYSNSTWIQKSSLRMAGFKGSQRYKIESKLPHAIHLDLPYQWSL